MSKLSANGGPEFNSKVACKNELAVYIWVRSDADYDRRARCISMANIPAGDPKSAGNHDRGSGKASGQDPGLRRMDGPASAADGLPVVRVSQGLSQKVAINVSSIHLAKSHQMSSARRSSRGTSRGARRNEIARSRGRVRLLALLLFSAACLSIGEKHYRAHHPRKLEFITALCRISVHATALNEEAITMVAARKSPPTLPFHSTHRHHWRITPTTFSCTFQKRIHVAPPFLPPTPTTPTTTIPLH